MLHSSSTDLSISCLSESEEDGWLGVQGSARVVLGTEAKEPSSLPTVRSTSPGDPPLLLRLEVSRATTASRSMVASSSSSGSKQDPVGSVPPEGQGSSLGPESSKPLSSDVAPRPDLVAVKKCVSLVLCTGRPLPLLPLLLLEADDPGRLGGGLSLREAGGCGGRSL
jgi:hypothetical protein